MSHLLLRNCRVLTMDPARPLAEAVLVRGGRIAWVGPDADAPAAAGGSVRTLDCGGGALLPGFHDAHLHLLAYAASLRAVDCGPRAVSSIEDIKLAISRRAADTTPGRWLRGSGYSDFDLAEKRHPTRWELDQAAPSHPVRLDHRSGHACVLNSVAMEIAGISATTDEPSGATIVRDTGSGEPTGLLLEFGGLLDGLIPRPDDAELKISVQRTSQTLASRGITSVHDATATNSVGRWDTFRSLKASGALLQRVTFMAGVEHIESFLSLGLRFLSARDDVTLGAAKVMVTLSSGRLHPGRAELREIVEDARSHGFPVAIHAVEAEAISAAADAIATASSRERSPGSNELRHRIEHCSELPPDVLSEVVASGAMVVTQPGFIYNSGTMYLGSVPTDTQPYLYRIGALARSGVAVAFGSDAPVADPDPLPGIYSAVTRRSAEGPRVVAEEGISVEDALRYGTVGSAVAANAEAHVGVVRPGMMADLVLLKRDPTTADPENLLDNQVSLTVMGGRVVWEA